jgi:hypothetical protein
MVETVAGAAGVPVAVGGIVAAVGVGDGLVVAGGIGDVAGLAGGDTRTFCHGFARIHADKTKATTRVVAFFVYLERRSFGMTSFSGGRFPSAARALPFLVLAPGACG